MTKKCEKMSTFEGGRCSSSNQAQSTGNSILDDFRPSAEKIEKISKNDENKSFDFRDYTLYILCSLRVSDFVNYMFSISSLLRL